MKPHSLKSIKRFLIEKKKQQKQTQEGIFENHVSIFHKSTYMMLIQGLDT